MNDDECTAREVQHLGERCEAASWFKDGQWHTAVPGHVARASTRERSELLALQDWARHGFQGKAS